MAVSRKIFLSNSWMILGEIDDDISCCFVFRLLQFVSHLSWLRWVNKLHSNVFHSPPSNTVWIWCFCLLFLLQFSHLCRLIRFHIALNFSSVWIVCKKFFSCKTNFITDLTLLLHQLRPLEIVSGNEIALLGKNKSKKKKTTFPFYFPLLPDNCCYRCWRNSINEILLEKTRVFLLFWGILRSFYHPLKLLRRPGQL